LFKLQEVTRQLRTMEKEQLLRMKELYGEEGEIIIEQIQRREAEYFSQKKGPQLLLIDEESTKQRSE
jgi:hypothetical protein